MKSILSSYGGVNNALKTNSKLVKGASKDYNFMTSVLDTLNYAGEIIALSLWNAGIPLEP